MGIDYGEKRVGISLSDDEGTFAFPHDVIENNRMLLDTVMELVREKEVGEIVLGESRKLSGEENIITKDIENFKKILETALDIAVHFEPEFFTSVQAKSIQKGEEQSDARAAALILQSYLDKENDRENNGGV